MRGGDKPLCRTLCCCPAVCQPALRNADRPKAEMLRSAGAESPGPITIWRKHLCFQPSDTHICIPFAALLRLFYNLTGSYGVSLILFTLVIKLILLPFQMKSKKSMVRMSRMSGKMQEIQKKYANNQLKMQEEMQKFYQEEGFNPMSGCLWSFLPLPILMALYYIIREPIVVLHELRRQGRRSGGSECGQKSDRKAPALRSWPAPAMSRSPFPTSLTASSPTACAEHRRLGEHRLPLPGD